MREDWINVNVGRKESEEANVVHGDVEALAEMNTQDRFKGDLV